jgi:outer membrane receptor protein involved in Fe transport
MVMRRFVTWHKSWVYALCATAAICAWSPKASARDDTRARIDLSATTLPEALAELSRETGVSVGAPGALPRLRVHPLHARLTIASALARLLAGSDYVARQVGDRAWRIERRPTAEAARTAALPAEEVAPAGVFPEIVVSATKRDLSLASAPMAAAVVALDSAHAHQPQSGTALVAASVEGLALTGEGAGRNRMFVRGVADSAFGGRTQSTVAVLLDDARITYEAPDPDIRLVDVERVELLKGPQGSLYGTGALGGIYRVVTRRADPSARSVSASTTLEMLRSGEEGVGASAVVNLPLVQDVAALRLVGYADSAPGWIDTGDRRASNRSTAAGVRAGLGVELGDWRGDATGFVQVLNSHDSSYVYLPDGRSRPAQLAEPHDNDLVHGSVRIERRGELGLVLSSGYTHHVIDDTFDATQGASGLGVADPSVLHDGSRYSLWDNEGRLTGHFGAIEWLAGLSHVEARHRTSVVLEGSSSTASLESMQRLSIENALFGEVTTPLARHLELTLGARVSRSSIDEERVTASGTTDVSHTRFGLTPSAALAFAPRESRLFYLRYGSAFRQGGIGVDANGRPGPLEPDELATVEGGWREQIGGVSFDLGLYHSWWNSLQSDRLERGGLVETITAGDAAISGVELSMKTAIADRWSLEAGASAQSAMLVSDPNGLVLDDRQLPVVPRWTMRASATRTFSAGPWVMSATGRLRYLGPSRLSFDPALDRAMGPTLDTGLDLRAARGHWLVAIEFANLFGAADDTFAYGNPLRLPVRQQFIPQEPFSARLSLVFRP